MELSGKTAVVIGATGGIGSKVVQEFAKEGAKVIAVARSKTKLTTIISSLPGKDHTSIVFDLANTSQYQALADQIVVNTSHVDILVNAAGIGFYRSLENLKRDEWETEMTVNVMAPVFITRGLLPLLKKSSQAVVFNFGSGMGEIPTAGRVDYCASKFALRGASLTMAREFEGTNVNIVHLTLGSVLTEFGPLTLKQKEEENLQGKAYLRPEWVAQKLVEIIKKGEFEAEIELYPSRYKNENQL